MEIEQSDSAAAVLPEERQRQLGAAGSEEPDEPNDPLCVLSKVQQCEQQEALTPLGIGSWNRPTSDTTLPVEYARNRLDYLSHGNAPRDRWTGNAHRDSQRKRAMATVGGWSWRGRITVGLSRFGLR